MTPHEFAAMLFTEKTNLLKAYLRPEGGGVHAAIEALGLGEDKAHELAVLVDLVLTDSFYTILLGLDGAARLGDQMQQGYTITDENGVVVTEHSDGELEEPAWEMFQDRELGTLDD